MQFLGCLLMFVVMLLFLGLAVVGSVLEGVWRFFGGGRRPSAGGFGGRQQEKPQEPKKPANTDYTFRPSDGEYIDYEEV